VPDTSKLSVSSGGTRKLIEESLMGESGTEALYGGGQTCRTEGKPAALSQFCDDGAELKGNLGLL